MKKLALLCLTATALSGCDWVLGLAKEGALSLTEHSGAEHFTLAGELPANFMLQATTKYSAVDPARCQTYSIGLGRDVTRQGYEQYDTGYADQPHTFSLKIPLTKHIGRCSMQAYQVSFRIRGRYGEKDWQAHSSTGGIGITAIQPAGAPAFSSEGIATMRGACTWLFQISPLYLELGKLLSCSETDESWQLAPDMIDRRSIGDTFGRDQLPGKTVYLEIREDPKERPAIRETWIEFPEGWKPCATKDTPEGKWIWCRNPPHFRTFQMNGKTCTVYPHCEEVITDEQLDSPH